MITFKIEISSGRCRKDLYTGLEENEAIRILDAYEWTYIDENEFEWDMDMVEEEEKPTASWPSRWWEPGCEDIDELDEMDPYPEFPVDYEPDEDLPF